MNWWGYFETSYPDIDHGDLPVAESTFRPPIVTSSRDVLNASASKPMPVVNSGTTHGVSIKGDSQKVIKQ